MLPARFHHMKPAPCPGPRTFHAPTLPLLSPCREAPVPQTGSVPHKCIRHACWIAFPSIHPLLSATTADTLLKHSAESSTKPKSTP